MPDYKAITETTSKWQRCHRMVIENRRGETPRLDCLEEVVTLTGRGESSMFVPGCSVTFDPAGVVPMRDPQTDALTGQSMTQAQIYAILYSVYRHAADVRDAQ